MKTFAYTIGGDYYRKREGEETEFVQRKEIPEVKELLRFAQISIYISTCNTNPEDNSTEIVEGRIYDVTKPSWL